MNDKQLLEYAIHTNPLRVELELTERCNLSCKFCYNSQNPIDSSLVETILQRLAGECVPEIVLTGGEPILHPQFRYILDLCTKFFQKTMIQTNGLMIDDTIADLILNKNVYEVNVSVHGSADVHDELTRNKGSHTMAIEAIKRLIARNVRVSSNFVMTKDNIGALNENLNELYELGVRCMTLTRFTPTGIGATNSELLLSREEIIKAIDIAEQFSKTRNVRFLLANSMPQCSLPTLLKKYCEHCNFGVSRFYIDIHGNVMMCGMARIVLGNITKETFVQIKEKSYEFANHVLGKNVPQICSTCANFQQCRGGCRAAALANTGDISGADPYLVSN